MILVGALIPSLILLPNLSLSPDLITLKSTWQIPSLLLCALFCGPKSALIASIGFLTIGLFYLPIFQGGGSIGYLLTPEFGYLAGFIPASVITGTIAKNTKKNNLIGTTLAAMAGVAIIQITGIINLVIGEMTLRWSADLSELLFSYSFSPLLSQLLICPAIAILTILLNRIFLTR